MCLATAAQLVEVVASVIPGCLGADGDNAGGEWCVSIDQLCDSGIVLERQSSDAVAWVG